MLEFEVNGQRLRLKGNLYVVAESIDYLKARFAFSADWDGAAKTAIFKTADRKGVYNVILDENGICTVPSEVIHAPRFYVSVFGGSRITANEVEVQCNVSGYAEGSAPDTPTPEIYEQILAEINKKVSKVDGMGLSENSYTTDEKTKLDGIAEGAEVNVQSDWSQTNADADDYIRNKPTKLSQFENDSGYAKLSDLGGLGSDVGNIVTALNDHKTAKVLDHPDGSVTKEKIADGVLFSKKYDDLTNVPTKFPPAEHSHTVNDISNLPPWVNNPKKPEYTAAEVGALPSDTVIPSYSAATQDADGLMSAADKKKLDGLSEGGGGGITEETDPTVPAWAKQPEKPTYTAAEVGADSAGSADSALTAAKKYTDEKVKTNVPENAVFTDTVYNDTEIKTALGSEETARTKADTTLQNNINSEASARSLADNELEESLNNHMGDTDNPHSVTKSQVGLGNVPNVATNDQTPTYTQASTLANLTSGEKLSVSLGKIMKAIADFITHKNSTSNPHSVTKSQVGLGNVPNVATNSQTPTYGVASSLSALSSGETLSTAFGKIAKAVSDFISHKSNTSNPHSVTKSQVGLGNVDNTSDVDKPVSTAMKTALNNKMSKTDTMFSRDKFKFYNADGTLLGSYSYEGKTSTGNGGFGFVLGIGNEFDNVIANSFTDGAYSTLFIVGKNNTVTVLKGAILGDYNKLSKQYNFLFGRGLQGSTTKEQVIAMGSYNDESIDTTYPLFFLGRGTSSADRSNAFRVDNLGRGFFTKSVSGTGADYAEYWEWKDGNPNAEDRVGKFVSFDGTKIRFATSNDDLRKLGIISGNPAVIGDNHADEWHSKYLTDVFGRYILTTETDADGNKITKLTPNPEYDNTQQYIPREKRKEWDLVGTHGKLVVYDDGTCQVDGYCRPTDGGIATASENGFYVMERINDTLIRVYLK